MSGKPEFTVTGKKILSSLTITDGPLGAVYRVYAGAMAVIAAVLIGGTATIMGTQVFFRYVLNDSLIWAEEVCGYMLVWTAFLFLGLAFQRGELVIVNILLNRLGRWGGFVCLIVAYGFVVAFLVMLVVYGYAFAEFNAITTIPAADFIWAGLTGSDTPIEMSAYWIYLSVPIGCGILLIHVLFWLWARIAAFCRGEQDGNPGDQPENRGGA